MKIKEIENININNKEKYTDIFIRLLKKLRRGDFDYQDSIEEDFAIINEDRLGGHFVHVVPSELLLIFERVRKDNPNDFLGLSVLVGKKKDKEVRLSCFGVPCSELTRGLII